MTEFDELRIRVTNLEARMDSAEGNALAARHLSAAVERDNSEFGIKIDANRRAINALSAQTASGFTEVSRKFREINGRFDAVNGKIDEAAVGQRLIVGMLERLIDGDGGQHEGPTA